MAPPLRCGAALATLIVLGALSSADGSDCPGDVHLDVKNDCVDSAGKPVDAECCDYISECTEAAEEISGRLAKRMLLYMGGHCHVSEDHLEMMVDGTWSVQDSSELCSEECLANAELEIEFPVEEIDAMRGKCSRIPAFEMIATQEQVIIALDQKWQQCKDESLHIPTDEDFEAADCPSGLDKVEIDVKGDCINIPTQEVIDNKCCKEQEACEEFLKTTEEFIMDRLNMYTGMCNLAETALAPQADGSWKILDVTALCSSECQGLASLKTPLHIHAFDEMRNKCYGVDGWEQMSFQEGLIRVIDAAWAECSATTSTTLTSTTTITTKTTTTTTKTTTTKTTTTTVPVPTTTTSKPAVPLPTTTTVTTTTITTTTITTTTITTTTITTTSRAPPASDDDLFEEVDENQRGTVYVIDMSGSMNEVACLSRVHYSRFDYAAYEVIKGVKRLSDKQYFNIILFSYKAWAFTSDLILATDENIEKANEWLGNQEPNGGTNIESGLQMAYGMHNVDSIHLLSDGSPNDGCRFGRLPCWAGFPKRRGDGPPIDTTLFMPVAPTMVNNFFILNNQQVVRKVMTDLATYTGGTFREPMRVVRQICPPRVGNTLYVQGCGIQDANGLYHQDGQLSGRQRYMRISENGRELDIKYSARERRWELVLISRWFRNQNAKYVNYNTGGMAVPVTGWVAGDGGGDTPPGQVCTTFTLNPPWVWNHGVHAKQGNATLLLV